MDLTFLVSALSGTLAAAGESSLDAVLQDLHDSNLADYTAAIQGGHALVQHLKPLVAKSKTKIDDIFINALDQAINMSAAANNVAFS